MCEEGRGRMLNKGSECINLEGTVGLGSQQVRLCNSQLDYNSTCGIYLEPTMPLSTGD